MRAPLGPERIRHAPSDAACVDTIGASVRDRGCAVNEASTARPPHATTRALRALALGRGSGSPRPRAPCGGCADDPGRTTVRFRRDRDRPFRICVRAADLLGREPHAGGVPMTRAGPRFASGATATVLLGFACAPPTHPGQAHRSLLRHGEAVCLDCPASGLGNHGERTSARVICSRVLTG
jgi:hypothetical protein